MNEPLDEYSERCMCERCNEYAREVASVPLCDGSGYWNLCEDCRIAVQEFGDEPEEQ